MTAGHSGGASEGLRIVLVIDNLARAGAQRQACLLLRGLRARGHAMLVLVLNDDTDAANLAQVSAVAEVEIIGKGRLAAGLGPLALMRRFRAWRPDVIMTMLEVSDVLGRMAGRLYSRAPVVTSIRARNAQKGAWRLWLDRHTMRWADRVVFNSAAVVEWSRQNEGVRPEQVRVIPNGVEIPDIPVPPAQAESLGIGRDARIAFAVGRLQPQKRIGLLLDALAQLPESLARTELLIAGTGSLQGELAAKAAALGLAARVHFLGNRQDVAALLGLAEVFVLPSAWEGMPNVVMEAMAAGCPVVATRIDGTAELLPDAGFGWLVEPDDAGQLAAALAEALTDRDEARRRAARARARVTQSFGVEAMVDRYEALFLELAAGN
jgi:glycosyltransferase involved in cell wall biosynthesis